MAIGIYVFRVKRTNNLALKLGLSMAQLGKTDEACLAFVNLPTEFANAPDNIKAKAKNEAKKMGCE